VKALRILFSLTTYNLPIKILSLLLAVAVWYGLDAEITDRTRQEVPLNVILLNQENWRIVERSAVKVRVTLKGARADIERISDLAMRDGLRGTIRFDEKEIQDKGQNQEVYTVAITPEIFHLRYRDLSFENIKPLKVQITLVRVGEKKLRVKPLLVGSPEKGYLLVRTKVAPSSVKVSGPLVALSKFSQIETEPVFLHGMDSTFEETVNLASTLDGFKMNARPVTVYVVITRQPGDKVVERVPLQVIYPAGWPHDRIAIEIDGRLDVRLEGPADIVEKMTADDLLAVVKLDNAAWNEWMDPKSQSQYAQAPLLCMVVGPTDEAKRVVEPRLPGGGSVRYKVIRRTEKK
jgi:YbbR domain-containing protein